MLGDDPDPTVTKVRFGFGTNFGRARGAMHCAKRDSGLSKRENEERGWSRKGQRKQGGTRQLRADASLKKTMTATSVDAMRMMS